MRDRLLRLAMGLVPKRALSRAVGRLVRARLPGPLARWSVERFARRYAIDMSDAERPLESYATIGELFTRRLKAGARPVGPGVVHPADALITEAGRVESGTLVQAKGMSYAVPELLGSAERARAFKDGSFYTYYLCPTDYHRVHAPVDGRVVWGRHIPGALWPVGPWWAGQIPGLFVENERVVSLIETARGRAALVMVAATNVGDIAMAFDEGLGQSRGERAYDPGIPAARGQEFGVFRMGSTVVMLYEKGLADAAPESWRGRRVRVGESLRP